LARAKDAGVSTEILILTKDNTFTLSSYSLKSTSVGVPVPKEQESIFIDVFEMIESPVPDF